MSNYPGKGSKRETDGTQTGFDRPQRRYVLKRREILTASVAGAAGLLGARNLFKGPVAEAAKKPGGCPPPPGTYTKSIPCLPPGLAELETPNGDVVEVIIPANGTLAVTIRSTVMLNGLWEVFEPADLVTDRTADGWVQHLSDSFISAGPLFTAAWMYRNPMDMPGTILKGFLNSQMVWRVDSGQATIPDLTVELVEWDVMVFEEANLVQFGWPSPAPPVRAVLGTYTLPGGSGLREIPVNPIPIPWNAKYLGIRRRTIVNDTTHVYLRSLSGQGLEIVPEQ